MDKHFLARADLAQLHQALLDAGYRVIGPQVQHGAIIFDTLSDISQLPWGRTQQSGPGSYTIVDSGRERCFDWNTGPQAFKPWLFRPTELLWTGQETDEGIVFTQAPLSATPLAFLGVRSCDLAALALQDKHFMHSAYPDPWYVSQREQMCIVAVNCAQSTASCFCVSTDDGPEVKYGFDVLLDELDTGYLVSAKSDLGNQLLSRLSLRAQTDNEQHQASAQLARAATQSRQMPDASALRSLLEHLDSPQWDSIAERCLACGNCTSVCPSCFCSKQEASQDLKSDRYQQHRYWDSCFSEKHGYIAGKNIRPTIALRYRQWLLHKLVTWQDQYHRSGCVGCGRCLDWCPVAIDLVAEVNTMLDSGPHD